MAAGETTFDQADMPGLYRARGSGHEHVFAVNVLSSESRTAPRAADELEQQGVALGRHASPKEQLDRLRQMRDVELESRQQIWRWLLVRPRHRLH